jgi:hypothetical protein
MSEQNAILSPYSINQFIFKTLWGCVYCAVRTVPVIQFSFIYVFCLDLGKTAILSPYSVNL